MHWRSAAVGALCETELQPPDVSGPNFLSCALLDFRGQGFRWDDFARSTSSHYCILASFFRRLWPRYAYPGGQCSSSASEPARDADDNRSRHGGPLCPGACTGTHQNLRLSLSATLLLLHGHSQSDFF